MREFIKNIARRHRPVALKLLTFVNLLRGLGPASRVRLYGARWRLQNLAQRNRRVILVSERPAQREAKIAFGLRRAGWEVILLHQQAPGFSDLSDFVEIQRFSSPWEAVELAHRARARVTHVFSPNCDDTCLRLVDNKPGRVVVDFFDHLFSVADSLQEVEARYAVDIARQRYCLTRADAICCRDLQMQYGRRITKVGRGVPLIYFPEYCWNTFSLPSPRDDKEVHIVQIGWMGFEARGMNDCGCFYILKKLVEAGCQVHVYSHPSFPPIGTSAFRAVFDDYLNLAAQTGRLHLHPTVQSDKIIEEIARYDVGINMSNGMELDIPWHTHNPARFAYCGSSRVFDYLDAGLSLLLSHQLKLMFRQFRGYRGLIDGSALLRSGRILETLMHRPERDHIAAVRETLSIERQVGRLTRFYENLA